MRRSIVNTLAFIALCLLAVVGAQWLPPEWSEVARAAAVLATGLGIIKLCATLAFRVAAPAAGWHPPRIVEELAVIVACAAWGLVRLRVSGVDTTSLFTTSALITGLIAFSMQDTLGNVLGGILLELDRSIRLGDWVKLDELSGRVVQIRWRFTTILTRNGERVIVPNATLIKSRFTVIGNPDAGPVRWRRWVWFDVDFDVPARRVVAAAEQALAVAEIPNVLREPKPDCALMEIESGQARYALRYWLADPQRDDGTDSLVRMHLLAALERSGIALSLPKLVDYEILENENRQTARMAQETRRRMAALRGLDLFAPLSEEELGKLASHLVHAPFLAGDVITRQGALAHWLYLLVAGEAQVWLESAEAPRRLVASLQPGTVFGEMGMLTGEPRRATVTAKDDVVCYRLDKAGFEEVLHARPALAEALSHVLAARSSGLAQAVQEAQSGAAVMRSESLLHRIRAFFGIDAGQTAERQAA